MALVPPLWHSQGGGWEGVAWAVACARCLTFLRTAPPQPSPALRAREGALPLPFGAAKGEVGRGWFGLLPVLVAWPSCQQPLPNPPLHFVQGRRHCPSPLAPPRGRLGGGCLGCCLCPLPGLPANSPLPNPPLHSVQGREHCPSPSLRGRKGTIRLPSTTHFILRVARMTTAFHPTLTPAAALCRCSPAWNPPCTGCLPSPLSALSPPPPAAPRRSHRYSPSMASSPANATPTWCAARLAWPPLRQQSNVPASTVTACRSTSYAAAVVAMRPRRPPAAAATASPSR